MTRIAVLAVLLALLLAGTAAATPQGQNVTQRWNEMDDCARKAQAAFPDFTAQSNARRDAKLKDCLANGNLPPRAPLSPH